METTPPYFENLPADESVYFLAPVLRHFSKLPYHVHSATVRWNKPLLVAELKSQLIRSKAGRCFDEDVPPLVRQRQPLQRPQHRPLPQGNLPPAHLGLRPRHRHHLHSPANSRRWCWAAT